MRALVPLALLSTLTPLACGGGAPTVSPLAEAAPMTAAAPQADVVPAVATTEAPDDAPVAESPPPAPKELEPPPPLPEGTVVAHFGDSMAEALGRDLKHELEAVGLVAPVKAKEATYIPQWAGTKWGVELFLHQHQPDFVIITLGGNETAMPDPTIRAEPVRRLVKKVGDTPCIWVAAPLWPGAKMTGILDVIRENCAPCRYVDTNALLEPKLEVLKSDGVHPTLPERKRWAKYMMRWLRHNRDPHGAKPWSLKEKLEPPPPQSEGW